MKRFGWIVLVVFLFGFIFSSCDGPAGLDGKDAEDFDHYPPEISLLNPVHGQEVFEDTLSLLARVRDESPIDRVLFTVQGKNTNGLDSAIAIDSPFVYLWNFVEGANSYGLLDVFATAWDTAGNMAASPLILIERKPRSGLDTLSYYFTNGSSCNYLVPDTINLKIETEEDSTRTLISDRVVVKFYPNHRCKLKSINVLQALNIDERVYDSIQNYWLILYTEDANNKPDSALDSVLVEFDPFFVNVWRSTDLSDFANLNPETIYNRDNPLLIGIRADVNPGLNVPVRGVALHSVLKPIEGIPHLRERLFRHNIGQASTATDSTWTTLWEGVNKKKLVIPSLSAVVEYQE